MSYPNSLTYEKIIQQSPWRLLIKSVTDYLVTNLKSEAKLIDCFCGPGYILNNLYSKRSDLNLSGVDSNQDFIQFAKYKNSNFNYIYSDFFDIRTTQEYDAVICTGGLHHVKNELKRDFIKHLFQLKKNDGFIIIGDPCINIYNNEEERKLASITLGQAYLKEATRMGAECDVLKELIQIMGNDIFYKEYKFSLDETKELIEFFTHEYELVKTWPLSESDYGDYYFIFK